MSFLITHNHSNRFNTRTFFCISSVQISQWTLDGDSLTHVTDSNRSMTLLLMTQTFHKVSQPFLGVKSNFYSRLLTKEPISIMFGQQKSHLTEPTEFTEKAPKSSEMFARIISHVLTCQSQLGPLRTDHVFRSYRVRRWKRSVNCVFHFREELHIDPAQK